MIGQYTFGTEDGSVSPDGYSLDLYYASMIPDYAEKQSDLIFDYQNNVKIVPVNSGHFALESRCREIEDNIKDFF